MAILGILKTLVLKIIFNELVVKRLVLASLKYFAKESSNKLDDELIKAVEEAWK